MATITTNVYTLAAKQLLIGATLELKTGESVTVVDFEIDRTGKYEIEATNGSVYLVEGWTRGSATADGATTPAPKNGGSRKKVTSLL